MEGKSIDQLSLGDSAFLEKTISESDVYNFAGITGDFNPAHLNQVEAEKGIFKTRIVHGMLSAGLISAVLGMYLPGAGAIYMSQNLKFTAPVFFGDTIRATVEIIEINIDRNICKLSTICTNQNNIVVISGEAIIKPVKK